MTFKNDLCMQKIVAQSQTHKTATTMTRDLSAIAFAAAFTLGLVLGNAGHLAKLGVVLKAEYEHRPCFSNVSADDGVARFVADNITDGVVNTTLQGDEDVNNVTLSQKSDTSKGYPTFLRETNVTQAQVISADEASHQNNATTSVNDTHGASQNDSSTNSNDDDICSLVAERTGGLPFSVSHLWTGHFDDILKASQHPNDPNYLHRDWMRSLLASVTPSMLQKGLRTRPSSPALKRVLKLVQQRMMDPQSTSPLKIAVVGGSVTQGGGCNTPPVTVEGYKATSKDAAECAWPKRLELLLNNLAGTQLVEVHNLAVGGTNLELATPLIKYWLYPDSLLPDGPDVIISSYSTNEQHTYPFRIDTTNTTTFSNVKRKRVNEFISAVHNSRPCDDPHFVMFLDDYLGNQQDRIVGEMTYNKIVSELAKWFGDVMHVSYADVVRRVVYADTDETIFTPAWPIVEQGEYAGQHKVEPHFGMAGHVTIAWTIMFSLGQAIAGYCENEHFVAEMTRMKRQTMIAVQVNDMIDTVPPPRLTTDLMLSNVTQVWQGAARQRQQIRKFTCRERTYGKAPCRFAFIAGPAGTVRNPGQLSRYLKQYGAQVKGWVPVVDIAAGGWSKKLGLVATTINATMTLKLQNIEKEIRMLNLQTLKSYGEKWEKSKARFTLKVQNPDKSEWIDTFDIEGTHESKTSESYAFEYDLKSNKAIKGSTVTLSIELIGGSTFKIIGMMLCNR